MDWWGEVRLALQGFLDQHGVLAGFVLVLIEEAGVPVPVPGDFLMLALGVHAHQGHVQLWQALLVLEIATLLGAGGRPRWPRFGVPLRACGWWVGHAAASPGTMSMAMRQTLNRSQLG
jgi:hypothetical protein